MCDILLSCKNHIENPNVGIAIWKKLLIRYLQDQLLKTVKKLFSRDIVQLKADAADLTYRCQGAEGPLAYRQDLHLASLLAAKCDMGWKFAANIPEAEPALPYTMKPVVPHITPYSHLQLLQTKHSPLRL